VPIFIAVSAQKPYGVFRYTDEIEAHNIIMRIIR